MFLVYFYPYLCYFFPEFYEEVLSLIYSLTCQQVSEPMWMVFEMIYEMFQKDGFDYFTGLCDAHSCKLTLNLFKLEDISCTYPVNSYQ
jgi:hypothetical protein